MILVQFGLSLPFSGLSTEQGSKEKRLLAEDKLLLNCFFLFDGLLSRSKHDPAHKTTTNQNSPHCEENYTPTLVPGRWLAPHTTLDKTAGTFGGCPQSQSRGFGQTDLHLGKKRAVAAWCLHQLALAIENEPA